MRAALVDEYWNELLAANAGWSMERLRAWVPEMSLPADQAAARQELAEIVKSETERLEVKAQTSTKKSVSSRQSTRPTIEHSTTARRRANATIRNDVQPVCRPVLQRAVTIARAAIPATVTRRPRAEYTRPRPAVFRQTDGPSGSPEKAELAALIESIRQSESAGASSSQIRNLEIRKGVN